MNCRIAIVGPQEVIAGFTLLGADIVAAHSQIEALEILYRLKKETQRDERGIERPMYGIIFVSEYLMTNLPIEEERKLAKGALPAIIPLPSHRGSTGFSSDRLRRIVERAVGSNILGI